MQVIGGPAYNCQLLERGDVILKIDSVEVDEDTLLTYLIGNDVPGSKVTITVMKANHKVCTSLSIQFAFVFLVFVFLNLHAYKYLCSTTLVVLVFIYHQHGIL